MKKSNLIWSLAAVVAMMLAPGLASAACSGNTTTWKKEGGIDSVWEERIKYTDHAGLAKAYSEGECKYKKGVHRGDDGTGSQISINSDHVTIWYAKSKKASYTCHVYQHPGTAAPGPNVKSPTTCYPNQ
ncbi:hypothetical protein [Undibacterium sp. TS12]|uniref:hypothetical protein n=1 Tax=Undibacterium sp. TS12 TaxID=2908202 RepID=UPI001F4CCB84|nr:hypothetical protein [Undibacterium sp. TS12]MCH8622797.1 hypothetical protein [Undibacterium sp. TS12]